MTDETSTDIRVGEVAAALPAQFDGGVYFIGRIRTPWRSRAECPKRGDPIDGLACSIELDQRWQAGLAGIERQARLQIFYWMHLARRDLVLQSPRAANAPVGTFALRSPVRPNPIASSVISLIDVKGAVLVVRGLDCVDGTPLIDIKPEHCPH